jgi:hypothetical protein
MGVGAIIRYYKKNVLTSVRYIEPYIFSPTTVEAFATWQVVELSINLTLLHVIIERDALEVVSALWNEGRCWS